MQKDVNIKIKSVQSSDNSSDTTELFTEGTLKKTETAWQLSYKESEATGFEGCFVTLDISDNLVKLQRKGNTTSCLIIELNKKHHCHYGTPYGDFMLGITADAIHSDVDQNGGNLYLKYTIDINSGLLSVNEMLITIKEQKDDKYDIDSEN